MSRSSVTYVRGCYDVMTKAVRTVDPIVVMDGADLFRSNGRAMMGHRNYEVSTHMGLRFLWAAAVVILDNLTLLVFITCEWGVLPFWDRTHKK